jgi:GNAT superfamily N-acetyltransferase
VVAAAADGTILGSAKMNSDQSGPGSHVASASFMVDPAHWAKGVGRSLGEHALDWARSEGYRAMQFNAVAGSDRPPGRIRRGHACVNAARIRKRPKRHDADRTRRHPVPSMGTLPWPP